MKPFSILLTLGCAVVGTGPWLPLGAAEPTEYEQYALELVNRARANPEAEVQRAVANSISRPGTFADFYDRFAGAPSLNEGPPKVSGGVYTIPAGPKQPLAFNLTLIDVTRSYAGLCQANDVPSHYINGTDPTGRMIAGGYKPSLPKNDALEVPSGSGQLYYPGNENISLTLSDWPWTSTDYAGDRRREALEVMHHGMFVDAPTAGRGHRVAMMVRDFREVGVGLNFGVDAGDWQSVYAVMDVGHQESRGPFITGVAYRELVADGFYTPGKGEALGDLTVQIRESGTTTEVASTKTFASGGYGVLVPPGHTYDVVFSGPRVAHTTRAVAVGTLNVKVDAIDPGVPVVPPVSSAFEITSITYDGNSAIVAWAATPGVTYRVATSPDLLAWTPLTASQQTATSSTLRYVEPSTGARVGMKYYRVERM